MVGNRFKDTIHEESLQAAARDLERSVEDFKFDVEVIQQRIQNHYAEYQDELTKTPLQVILDRISRLRILFQIVECKIPPCITI